MDKYNMSPIETEFAKVYKDGDLVFDMVTAKIWAVPRTKTYYQDGKRSTRNVGEPEYQAQISKRRTTPWTLNALKSIKKGGTPEFQIQIVQSDPNSDYELNGNKPAKVTAVGCVITSDIILGQYDTESVELTDEVDFNVYDVLMQ